MRVKKYPQSHIIVSSDSSKIIIDAGSVTFGQGFKAEEFQGFDAYLFTHTHPDHLDPAHVKEVVGDKPVFGNPDVVKTLNGLGIEAIEIKDRQVFQAGGFEITAVDLPHCKMQDGTDGPPNTGFLISGVLFHPGDGDKAPQGITSLNVALPIAGPTITLEGALQFAKELQAKVVIPIHNDYFHNDPEQFKQLAETAGIEVRLLNFGEETEI